MGLYPFFASPATHQGGYLAGLTAPAWNPVLLTPLQAQALVWLLMLGALAGFLGKRTRAYVAPLLLGYGYFLSLDYKAWWGMSAPLLALAVAVLAGAGRRPLRLLFTAAAALAAVECTGVSLWTLGQLVLLALPWPRAALPVLVFQALYLEGLEYAVVMVGWLYSLAQVEDEQGGWAGLVAGLAVLLACGLSLPPGVEYARFQFVLHNQSQQLVLRHPRPGAATRQPVEIEGDQALLPAAAVRARPRILRDPRYYEALRRALERRLQVPVTVEKSARPPES